MLLIVVGFSDGLVVNGDIVGNGYGFRLKIFTVIRITGAVLALYLLSKSMLHSLVVKRQLRMAITYYNVDYCR